MSGKDTNVNKKVLRLFVLMLGVGVLVACGSDTQNADPAKTAGAADVSASYRLLEGSTMGTYYRVQYRQTQQCAVAQNEVDTLLVAFNQSLSTYIPTSEISVFNQARSDIWVALSPRFSDVLQAALQIWRESEGAFDVTIGPLVNLWGFGPDDVVELPSAERLRQAAGWVGMQQLQFDWVNGAALKKIDEVYVDLSALAKGLGVDEVADYLVTSGCDDFMVDIGGEMRTLGNSPSGRLWRIGIERPVPGQRGLIQKVLAVSGQGVATSGDYRNFRQVGGVRVDHVIDPRSGRPAENRVASVTVIHPQAQFADAYATTIMVLGVDRGMALAERLQLPVLIVEKSTDDTFVERYTAPMRSYFVAPSE